MVRVRIDTTITPELYKICKDNNIPYNRAIAAGAQVLTQKEKLGDTLNDLMETNKHLLKRVRELGGQRFKFEQEIAALKAQQEVTNANDIPRTRGALKALILEVMGHTANSQKKEEGEGIGSIGARSQTLEAPDGKTTRIDEQRKARHRGKRDKVRKDQARSKDGRGNSRNRGYQRKFRSRRTPRANGLRRNIIGGGGNTCR